MAKIPNVKHLPISNIRWSTKAQRYINARGQFVSQARVEVVLEQNIAAQAHRIDALMIDLQTVGPSGIDLWEMQMRRIVKDLHLQNAALAEGGFHNITPQGYGRAGYQIKYNYGRIKKWAAEMRADPSLLDGTHDAALRFRGMLYAANGRETMEWVKWAAHKRNGFLFVENVLDPEAKHCTSKGGTIGCIEMTERGRMPIDDWVNLGDRSCGPNDKCRSRYFKTAS